VGWAERLNRAAGLPRVLVTRLSGLRIAVDVQHLYKPPPHDQDRGAVFTLANGTKVCESQIATLYAQALVTWLHSRGATVMCNDLLHGRLTGTYAQRNLDAFHWGAHAYLACHVNAGGGSYCLAEYPAGTTGGALGGSIGACLVDDFRELLSSQLGPLTSGQRGFVCIGECDRSRPAVILEPFFGDNPRHQALIPAARLVAVGESIGEGVARWWERLNML
jgi:N-acetylmuramoyl-L-alanine amidase